MFLQGHWTQASMQKAETVTYKCQSNTRRREDLPRALQAHIPPTTRHGQSLAIHTHWTSSVQPSELEEEPAKG